MISLFPDPTLTVENVTTAMEKVTVDERREVWWEMMEEGAVEEIYSNHSSEKERLYSCASHLVCKADSSWKDLVQRLYANSEMAAAKEAKFFLQQKGRWLILLRVHVYHFSYLICMSKISLSSP